MFLRHVADRRLSCRNYLYLEFFGGCSGEQEDIIKGAILRKTQKCVSANRKSNWNKWEGLLFLKKVVEVD